MIAMIVTGMVCGALVNGFQDLLVLTAIMGLGLMLLTPGEFDAPPSARGDFESLIRVGQGIGVGALLVAILADFASRTPLPVNNVWILGGGAALGVAASLGRPSRLAQLCDSLWKTGTAILIAYAVLTTLMLHEALTLLRPVIASRMRWDFNAVIAQSPNAWWKAGIPFELAAYAGLLAAAACLVARRPLWQGWAILCVGIGLSAYFGLWYLALAGD